MPVAALALGGNIGDVASAFEYAISQLNRPPCIFVLELSSVYITPAWGYENQPDFLNMAVLVETDLPPEELLDTCLNIERAAGRDRGIKWGPRTLDIDLIFYDDLKLETLKLTLPHPHAHERAFVLAPLRDIAPKYQLNGKIVQNWCNDLPLPEPHLHLTKRLKKQSF